MLSSIVAFSIFITQSTGNGVKTLPYIPDGQVAAAQYQSEKACNKDLDAIQDRAHDVLDDKYTRKDGSEGAMAKEIEAKEIDSMRCKQVDVKQAAAPEQGIQAAQQRGTYVGKTDTGGFAAIWKVGRMEGNGVFHGTQYNPAAYANENACYLGLEYAYAQVIESSQRLGNNGSNAVNMLDQFKSQYGCVELTVDVVTAQQMLSRNPTRIATDNYAPGMNAPTQRPAEQEAPAAQDQQQAYNYPSEAPAALGVRYVRPLQLRAYPQQLIRFRGNRPSFAY